MKYVQVARRTYLDHDLQQFPTQLPGWTDEQGRPDLSRWPRLVELPLDEVGVHYRVQCVLTVDAVLVRAGCPRDRHLSNVLQNISCVIHNRAEVLPRGPLLGEGGGYEGDGLGEVGGGAGCVAEDQAGGTGGLGVPGEGLGFDA
jgi:hypothetical protein